MISKSSNKQIETSIYEDIHWILLISGFVLIDIDTEIESKIPDEIMEYSIKISSLIDINLTRKLFKGEKLNEIDFNYCDPICRLIFTTIQLCELETQLHSTKMSLWSPQVSTTLMWFLKEFSSSYLFMKEKNYEQVKRGGGEGEKTTSQ